MSNLYSAFHSLFRLRRVNALLLCSLALLLALALLYSPSSAGKAMTEQQPHAAAPMSSSPAQVDLELRGKSQLQGIDVCGDKFRLM